MEAPDEEIMLEYQSGKDEAIEVIFQRYKIRVLNFCLRILGNRADAEDVTGDVFLRLFSKKYSYDPNAKFSTWLFTVARNCCISRLRKKKNLVSVWFTNKETDKYDQWDVQDTNDLPEEDLAKKEASTYVREAIQKLPSEQRDAIILREYHGFSYDQIAQVLNCSLEKVKILIFRAREGLRGHLISFMREGDQ